MFLMLQVALAFVLSAFSCNESVSTDSKIVLDASVTDNLESITALPGYQRLAQPSGSFGEWLRGIALKKDNGVYLYDGQLKKNQAAQFAVLDIPVGTVDLQQCADAVMRLRAEWLYAAKRYAEICFRDNNKKEYRWHGKNNRVAFEKYMTKVFSWCGTASLEKQLKPVDDPMKIKPGDVFIKGGFPGHAMLVVDVAENKKGQRIFMLAQSYMPAQDIHIVKNPSDIHMSPWYDAAQLRELITPEWVFNINQLKQW